MVQSNYPAMSMLSRDTSVSSRAGGGKLGFDRRDRHVTDPFSMKSGEVDSFGWEVDS